MMPIATLVLLLGTAAYASNVHFKPPNGEPSFIDGGLVLTASGALAGLGNGDIVINMTATADATATCTNPAGATQPAGRNPAPVTVGGQEIIPAGEIKNGTVSFSVTTTKPKTPVSGAPDCPNPNWREDITDLLFKTATITVDQPADTLVLTISCALVPPTVDGPVPASDVACR
jgi:hypothetical protein